MDITRYGELLKDATTPERKIEILSLMVEEQRQAIVIKDNLILQQRNELTSVLGKVELYETFKKDEKNSSERVSELESENEYLRRKLKSSNANESLYLSELSKVKHENKVLQAKFEGINLELETIQFQLKVLGVARSNTDINEPKVKVQEKVEAIKQEPEIIKPEPVVQNVYNIYGTYNNYGHLDIKG